MLSRFLVLLVSILVSIVLAVGANDTMTKNLKVLVSSSDFPESGLKVLKEHFTVLQTKYRNFGEEGLNQTKEDLLKLIPGVSALVWVSYHPITKELLDKAGPQLKLVATVSAGYNHCNLDELRARGIKLANTPNVLSSAVAEIAVSLMLGAARRFTENLDQVRSGNWEIGFDAVLGQDLRGSTVGIIGFGGIGHATARRLAGFEVAKFLYSGHREKPEAKELGAEFVSQDELLRQSDFILLAVPLTNDTKLMINKDTLAMMKSNAILVNVGRGDLVDQDALYDALKSRQIYAAGLDVTTPEPLPKDHKLLTLPNIFILPHIGSATVRTRSDMAVLAANNVVNALTGKPLLTPVQFGEWKPGVQWLLGQDVTSSTIGVVGFGGLGQAIARRLRGFDIARLLSSGRTHKPEAKTLEAERVLLEQLLKESDFVILCCPLTDETKHLINADSLKIMKKTAVLVNVARGDVIDHDALVTALKENTIFSAALVDVTTPEPLPKDHPLVSLPNCYVIDHDALVTALKENTIFSAALVDVTTPEPLPKDHPLVSLPNCFRRQGQFFISKMDGDESSSKAGPSTPKKTLARLAKRSI